jgi:hypothetical protein
MKDLRLVLVAMPEANPVSKRSPGPPCRYGSTLLKPNDALMQPVTSHPDTWSQT